MRKEKSPASTGPSMESHADNSTSGPQYTSDGTKLAPTFALKAMRAVSHTGLPPIARSALIAIIDHVNGKHGYPVAWPGEDDLMRITGCKTRETIERALDAVKRAGYIRITYHTGDGKVTDHKWSASRQQNGRAYIVDFDRLMTPAKTVTQANQSRDGFSDTESADSRVGFSDTAASAFSDEPCRIFRSSRVGKSDTTVPTLPNSSIELSLTVCAREENKTNEHETKSEPSPALERSEQRERSDQNSVSRSERFARVTHANDSVANVRIVNGFPYPAASPPMQARDRVRVYACVDCGADAGPVGSSRIRCASCHTRYESGS